MQRQVSNVADSTDWIATSLPSFAALESALRCQVCKDFYDTPMITTCSHTFCSLCIRRCLSNDGKCPTCRAGDQAMKLRRNWAIQEVSDAFKGSREAALELATQDAQSKAADRNQEQRKGRKRKRGETLEDVSASQGRQTRRSTRQAEKEKQAAVIAVDTDSEEEDASYKSEQHSFTTREASPVEDGLVACPMCSTRMKEEFVFGHLDKCTGEAPPSTRQSNNNTKPPPTSRSAHFPPQTPRSPPPKSSTPPTPSRLAQLNYSLLKDNALKKKLSELGIPNWGSRQLLIKRHTEWVDIYNSNSDSVRPRPVKALLGDLNVWEKSQGGSAPHSAYSSNGVHAQQSSVMAKDFDTDEWKGRHKDQFGDLIAQARAKAREQKEKAEREAEREKAEKDTQGAESTEAPHVNGAQTDTSSTPIPMDIDIDTIPTASAQGDAVRSLLNEPTPPSNPTRPPPSPGLSPSQDPTAQSPNPEHPPPRKFSTADRRKLSHSVPAMSLFAAAADSVEAEDIESAESKLGQMRRNAARPVEGSPERAKKMPMFLLPQHSTSDIDDAQEAVE